MKENYITRFGTLDDLDQLVPLFDRYRQFYGEPPQPNQAKHFLKERMALGQSIIIVAETGNLLIGFIQLFPSFSSVTMQRLWILNDLFVDERLRSHGVGRQLLQSARTFCVNAGAKELFIEGAVVNTRARRLYELFGFLKNSDYVYYHLPINSAKYDH